MKATTTCRLPDIHSIRGNAKKDTGFTRNLRGLWSTLTGLAFPLGGWWIGDLGWLRDEARRQKGYVLVLPGSEGKSSLNFDIVRGLVDGGVSSAIEIHDWTTGFWPLFVYHLRHSRRAQRKAVLVAKKILAYQTRYPNRPTFLIGHSGGASLLIQALECLPAHHRVTAAFLLGPAISRSYDLSRALRRTELGIWSFYSPLDLLFLTLGTLLAGTADGKHAVAAGAWGFWPPEHLSAEERQLYATRLHQVHYQIAMAHCWTLGGHFGWANRLFAASWLGGLIMGSTEETR